MNRVVVTGIGMVTPLAYKTDDTWSRLIEGKSGINKIVSFDTDDLKFARQNIDGDSRRVKLRFRYYGDIDEFRNPQFEEKIKSKVS